MRKLVFLVITCAVMLTSCQKEEVINDQLDEVLESLEFKNDSDRSDESRCFYFLFPISVDMPDGTILSGDSRKELSIAIISWFKENGRYKKERISLHFPVQVSFQERTLTLENERQLERLSLACRGAKDRDVDIDKEP